MSVLALCCIPLVSQMWISPGKLVSVAQNWPTSINFCRAGVLKTLPATFLEIFECFESNLSGVRSAVSPEDDEHEKNLRA